MSTDARASRPRSRRRRAAAPATALALCAALAAAACGEGRSSAPGPAPGAPTAPTATAATSTTTTAPAGPDPARGARLVEQLECARCHDGVPGAASIAPVAPLVADARPDSKHCFRCHQAIRDGHFQAPRAATTERWKKHIELLCDVPSLAGAGGRFRRAWVESFLLRPADLRPRLAPTMPRLDLTPEQARDIAAFLVPADPAAGAAAPVKEDDAVDPRGKELFAVQGCGSCHLFTGALPPPAPGAGHPEERGLSSALRLAPDLRHTRERMTLPTVMALLKNPKSLAPDALMPEFSMSDADREALAEFILRAPLLPLAPEPPPARLPVLARRVSYEEVKQRVFNKVCWHCHSDADYAIGDGGPGNTGGFGFKPRGLNLGAYEGIASGSLDDQGERQSVFVPMADGTPRLLASLLARQGEQAGNGKDGPLRGMPLGLPALPPEDIQLVETWIAQGHLPD